MVTRVIEIVNTADTEGHKSTKYYKIEDSVKSEIKYMDITQDEKHKLLVTMGLIKEKE